MIAYALPSPTTMTREPPESKHSAFAKLPPDALITIFSYLTPQEQGKTLVNRLTYTCLQIPRLAVLERLWRESKHEDGISAHTLMESETILQLPMPIVLKSPDAPLLQIRPELLPSPDAEIDKEIAAFRQRCQTWIWENRHKIIKREKLKKAGGLYSLDKWKDLIAELHLEGDWALIFKILSLNNFNFVIPYSVKNDEYFMRLGVTFNYRLFLIASLHLRKNFGAVKRIVGQNGLALAYASDKLRSDPEIIMTAVAQNALAKKYARYAVKELPNIPQNQKIGRAIVIALITVFVVERAITALILMLLPALERPLQAPLFRAVAFA